MTHPSSGLVDRWVRLWDSRERATSLALTRILVGSVVTCDLLVAKYEGAVPALFTPPPLGMSSGAASSPLPALASWLGSTPATATLLFWAALSSALLFTVGALYRPAALALAFLLAEFARFAPDGDAIDALFRVAIPILALSGAHARFSVDAWLLRRHESPLPERVPAWPRRLLSLQLVWVYFSAAHNRDDPAWWPQGHFSAIGRILQDPQFTGLPPGSVNGWFPVTQAATVLTMTFELSAPLMILFAWLEGRAGTGGRAGRLGDLVRRFHPRWLWLGLGVAIHLGIALTMQLGIFPFGMLALYPVFLRPDDYRVLRRILSPLFGPERGHA